MKERWSLALVKLNIVCLFGPSTSGHTKKTRYGSRGGVCEQLIVTILFKT